LPIAFSLAWSPFWAHRALRRGRKKGAGDEVIAAARRLLADTLRKAEMNLPAIGMPLTAVRTNMSRSGKTASC